MRTPGIARVGEARPGAAAVPPRDAAMVIRSQLVRPDGMLRAWAAPVTCVSVTARPVAVVTTSWVATGRGTSSSSWIAIGPDRLSGWSKLTWIHWPTGGLRSRFGPGTGRVVVEGVDRVGTAGPPTARTPHDDAVTLRRAGQHGHRLVPGCCRRQQLAGRQARRRRAGRRADWSRSPCTCRRFCCSVSPNTVSARRSPSVTARLAAAASARVLAGDHGGPAAAARPARQLQQRVGAAVDQHRSTHREGRRPGSPGRPAGLAAWKISTAGYAARIAGTCRAVRRPERAGRDRRAERRHPRESGFAQRHC